MINWKRVWLIVMILYVVLLFGVTILFGYFGSIYLWLNALRIGG